jgi:hypothetical protein
MRKTNSYVEKSVTTQNEPSNGHYFRRLSGTVHPTNNNTLANDPRYTIVDLGPPKNKVCFDENAEDMAEQSDDSMDGIRGSEVEPFEAIYLLAIPKVSISTTLEIVCSPGVNAMKDHKSLAGMARLFLSHVL